MFARWKLLEEWKANPKLHKPTPPPHTPTCWIEIVSHELSDRVQVSWGGIVCFSRIPLPVVGLSSKKWHVWTINTGGLRNPGECESLLFGQRRRTLRQRLNGNSRTYHHRFMNHDQSNKYVDCQVFVIFVGKTFWALALNSYVIRLIKDLEEVLQLNCQLESKLFSNFYLPRILITGSYFVWTVTPTLFDNCQTNVKNKLTVKMADQQFTQILNSLLSTDNEVRQQAEVSSPHVSRIQ